jgi:hypothetical protein
VNVGGERTASGSCSKAVFNRLDMSHRVSHLFFISSAFVSLEQKTGLKTTETHRLAFLEVRGRINYSVVNL